MKENRRRDLQNRNVKKKGEKGNERNGIGKDGEEKGNALTLIRPNPTNLASCKALPLSLP